MGEQLPDYGPDLPFATALAGIEDELAFLRGVSEKARAVVEYDPTPDQTHWPFLDHELRELAARDLRATMQLEGDLTRLAWSPLVPSSAQEPLRRYTDSWHDALPFVGSECRELASAYHETEIAKETETGKPTRWHQNTLERLWLDRIYFMAGGQRLEPEAGSRVGRWWGWRRGTEEFSENNTVDEMKLALGNIATILANTLGDLPG